MKYVQPNHPIAHEAYETIKAMNCEFISIVAKAYPISPTETGYFIAGIFPSTVDNGFNREEWISEFEKLQGIEK